ncbi:MFS general substrate transporter [Fomitiporia mediterranea MF3/22]|uniref:MFS general substrate transporter n=1 Tax=Fomitiporia mediterranea (strain MF3/22) TaxID=694068 RepID=UPI00044098D4|nr:MFS general substrate transporter [Fomitiporia mediterranea MF3/22]EJD01968.1 MFS general substrate transporter [Fomitiporia mediterranea MF3/22]
MHATGEKLDKKRASVSESASEKKAGLDEAWLEAVDFGGASSLPPPPDLTAEEEKRLYRKIDLRLMPILSLMYLCSYLDRGNAKLAGLVEQLNLTGNKYNIALTILVLKKFRPSRWLPGITVVWGIVMAMMGLVKSYPQLVVVRIFLGFAEAGLFPGVVYYFTFWYPRHMLMLRIAYFYGAATIAGAFSGLLAFAIEFMDGAHGLRAWSWIFILEGIATVTVGLLAFLVLVDFPATAHFLTPEERAYVIHKKKYDNTQVGEAEKFEWRYAWAALSDWQVWLHLLVYFSFVGPIYGISLFMPFGFSVPITQLLTVPPYIVATLLLLTFAYFSDKIKMRSPFILIGLTMMLIGFTINISPAPHGVKYFGVFLCVGGSYSAFPAIVAWLGNNLAGQYKRGVGMALHIGLGNFSGAIASNIYRSQDAPRYLVGHGVELMFVGIGFVFVPLLVFLYNRINKKRKAELERSGGISKYTVEELHEMGDRAPDFVYSL